MRNNKGVTSSLNGNGSSVLYNNYFRRYDEIAYIMAY